MYSSVSVDGFVADENDQPGPLFDWLSSGDVPLDESGEVKVSQTSYDYTRPYWDQIGATIVGRHVFDMTDGWDGKPPGGIDHVVVVTHRPEPEGWDPEAPFHFVDGVEAAVAKAQELAGDRIVEVAAGDVGGQALAAGEVLGRIGVGCPTMDSDAQAAPGARSCRSTAHPIAQVKHPVALNHHVRILQQVLRVDRPEVALAGPHHHGRDVHAHLVHEPRGQHLAADVAGSDLDRAVARDLLCLGHGRLDAADEAERRLGVPALGRRPV